MNPILYLTSELVNRDWDSRLMIADYAVAAGFSVVVGQQWNVLRNAPVLPKGMILVKTMNTIQGSAMAALKNLGMLVAAMDEEALPVAIDRDVGQEFLARSYAPVAIQSCTVFLANSPLHKQALARFIPELAQKTVVTGSARVDLLSARQRVRYAEQAQALREKHGRFILFNSNTASRNSIWTKEQFLDIQVRAGVLDKNDPVKVKVFEEQLEFEEKNAAIFEAMLKWCATHVTSHNIVVRPHPSENVEYWTKFAAENPRVYVAWGTPHIPYMLASDIVIHTNCTTGIEAAALDRPTINLAPLPDSHWARLYFAANVSPTYGDLDSATAALKRHLQGAEFSLAPDAARHAELLRYYPCIEHALSAQMVAEVMTRMLVKAGATPGVPVTIAELLAQYKHVPLEKPLRKKFSKNPDEAIADIKATRLATGLTHGFNFSVIDESLYLLAPKP